MFKYQYQKSNKWLCPACIGPDPVCCCERAAEGVRTAAAVRHRLSYMVSIFHGTMWRDVGHESRMESVCFFTDFAKPFGTSEYFAAVYLLTSGNDLYRRTLGCYTSSGIRFDRARRRGISIRDYDLLGAAKTIYYGTPDLTLDDLASCEIIDSETFRLITNALFIARYGPGVLLWGAR